MIRINLLATERRAEGGKGKTVKVPSAPGTFQAWALLGLGVGGSALVCGFLWWLQSSYLANLDREIAQLKQRQQALQVIKAQVEEFEKKKKLLDTKVNLIERLKLEQTSSVHMLDEISKALPDFVWLGAMDQTGATVKFTGQSNSLTSVADFITNLQKTGWFPRVELETSAETNNIVNFTVTGSFENPEVKAKLAAQAQAAAAAAPAPAAPAQPKT